MGVTVGVCVYRMDPESRSSAAWQSRRGSSGSDGTADAAEGGNATSTLVPPAPSRLASTLTRDLLLGLYASLTRSQGRCSASRLRACYEPLLFAGAREQSVSVWCLGARWRGERAWADARE